MNRYDDHARLVFHYAREEGNRLGHAVVGPEHLLLGLMRTEGGARTVLESASAELNQMRRRLQQAKPASMSGALVDAPSITPRARRVMEVASQEARALGAGVTSTQHILLGILLKAGDDPVITTMLSDGAPDLGRLAEQARAIIPEPSIQDTAPEFKEQAAQRAEWRENLQILLDAAMSRDGAPPSGLTETALLGLTLGGGDAQLAVPLEKLLYTWLTGPLPEATKHALLLQLLAAALPTAN
jgi:ATP-dependent Clp protease ATP-binding subunit ClpA